VVVAMDVPIIDLAKQTIEEEIRALNRLKDSIDESFEKAVKLILETQGKVVVTGMGKSGLIGKKIAATLSSTGTPAFFLHPAEALHGDLGMVEKNDLVIAISNSGETPELMAIVPILKRWGNKIIAITNRKDSSLAKLSDVVLYLNVDKEACPLNLAPTSTSTATLVLGDALAVVLLKLRDFKSEDFAMFHPGGSLGKKLMRVSQIMRKDLPIVKEDTPLKEAVLVISEKGLGATLVVDNEGNLVGIITDGDLRRFINKGKSIDNSLTKEAMTLNPKTSSPDWLVLQALEVMEKYNITVLPVVEDKKPVGIIHIHDILKSGAV
jgi:arabinose-5-phosphate isomerase